MASNYFRCSQIGTRPAPAGPRRLIFHSLKMDQDPDQADLASRAILNKEREERIKVRRERIQAKIAARQSGRTGEALDKKTQKEQEKEERLQPRRGLDEVEKSRRRLARFAEEVTNEVTDVRVASDDWETQRRATEEALRIER
jgi:hypothetical protein